MDITGDNIRVDPVNGNTNSRRLLYLFAPRTYSNQQLRPYVYGFSEDNIDFLLGRGDTLSDAYKRKDVQNSEATAMMIRPDARGTTIDMTGFSACWTFVLILDLPNNYVGSIQYANGSKRMVYKGHCGDEPLAPGSQFMSTPILNPECRLFIHSREMIRVNDKTIGPFGMHAGMDIIGSTDVIDGCLDMCAENRELYLMTPADVLDKVAIPSIGDTATAAPALCAIANDRKAVAASLKDPGLHLRQILQGIDASASECETAEFAPHGADTFHGALSAATDCGLFKDSVTSQLSMMSSGESRINQAIDITNVLTLGEIDRIYPDIQVIPIMNGSSPMMMDIMDQSQVSKRNVYSSMAASAISSIAASCGLGSIGFMYQSYVPNSDALDKSGFQVVEKYTTLTYPPPNPEDYNRTIVAAVQLFRQKLQTDLVPFIKYVCGEFSLQAYYSFDQDTMVNLQFLDENNPGDAWFEAPMRLSSLTSTSVGNVDNFVSNGQSLNLFVAQVQGKTQKGALGLAAFDRPGIDMGNGGLNNTQLSGIFS